MVKRERAQGAQKPGSILATPLRGQEIHLSGPPWLPVPIEGAESLMRRARSSGKLYTDNPVPRPPHGRLRVRRFRNTPWCPGGTSGLKEFKPHPCPFSPSEVTTNKLTLCFREQKGEGEGEGEAVPDCVDRKLPWR